MPRMIVTGGLTPAWQRTLVFERLQMGGVNRAREARECAGGKVLNAAVALRHLEARVKTVAPVGGDTGAAVRRDVGAMGIQARWLDTLSPTRTCTTLLAGGVVTELVENAGMATREELEAYAAAFAQEVVGAEGVVLTGSLPLGAPPGIYRTLIASSPAPVVLDARGNALLEALGARPFLIKPNRRELAQTLGRDLEDEKSITAAMAELSERGASWVVVTDSAGPVRVRGEGKSWKLQPPPPETMVNPIGSGDCLAAGVSLALARGKDPLEAVRLGIAAAVDNLRGLLPARLDPRRVARLAERVRAESL